MGLPPVTADEAGGTGALGSGTPELGVDGVEHPTSEAPIAGGSAVQPADSGGTEAAAGAGPSDKTLSGEGVSESPAPAGADPAEMGAPESGVEGGQPRGSLAERAQSDAEPQVPALESAPTETVGDATAPQDSQSGNSGPVDDPIIAPSEILEPSVFTPADEDGDPPTAGLADPSGFILASELAVGSVISNPAAQLQDDNWDGTDDLQISNDNPRNLDLLDGVADGALGPGTYTVYWGLQKDQSSAALFNREEYRVRLSWDGGSTSTPPFTVELAESAPLGIHDLSFVETGTGFAAGPAGPVFEVVVKYGQDSPFDSLGMHAEFDGSRLRLDGLGLYYYDGGTPDPVAGATVPPGWTSAWVDTPSLSPATVPGTQTSDDHWVSMYSFTVLPGGSGAPVRPYLQTRDLFLPPCTCVTEDGDYRLTSWKVDGGYAGNVVNAPSTLNFTHSGLPEGLAWTATVNGADHDGNTTHIYSEVFGHGASVNFGAPVQISPGGGTRYQLANWTRESDGATVGTVQTVTGDETYVAVYGTQHFLTVTSAHDTPVGEGWYDAGETAQAGLDDQVVSGPPGTRHVFTGWGGDASGPSVPAGVLMDGPKEAVALWRTEHEIGWGHSTGLLPEGLHWTVQVNGAAHGGATPASHVGWFEAGQELVFSVADTILSADGSVLYRFVGWVDSDGSTVGSPQTAEGPERFTALYEAVSNVELVEPQASNEDLTLAAAGRAPEPTVAQAAPVPPAGQPAALVETASGPIALPFTGESAWFRVVALTLLGLALAVRATRAGPRGRSEKRHRN